MPEPDTDRTGGFFGHPMTPVFNGLVDEVGDPYAHDNDIKAKLEAGLPAVTEEDAGEVDEEQG